MSKNNKDISDQMLKLVGTVDNPQPVPEFLLSTEDEIKHPHRPNNEISCTPQSQIDKNSDISIALRESLSDAIKQLDDELAHRPNNELYCKPMVSPEQFPTTPTEMDLNQIEYLKQLEAEEDDMDTSIWREGYVPPTLDELPDVFKRFADPEQSNISNHKVLISDEGTDDEFEVIE